MTPTLSDRGAPDETRPAQSPFSNFNIASGRDQPIFRASAAARQPAADNRPRTASISGRVTVGGAPAANATVMVAEVDPRSRGNWPEDFGGVSQQRAFIKVRTDGDGR